MPAQPDPVVHAYVRAHATLRLIAELPPELVRKAFPGRVSVRLSAPGGPRCTVRVRDGAVSFSNSGRGVPTVSLWFPAPVHMAQLLSGGKATVFPIPTSPRFLAGVRAFRALTGAVRDAIGERPHRIRLLLMGTLFALEEVANHDSYVAARVARIPDGTISVFVENDPESRGWFSRGSGRITTGSGTPTGEPNAELVFADPDTAEALLTGRLPAMLALAERKVRLYGRIPMIQNLFPILDRVAVYMGGQS